ncbi:MAG: ATP11 family protein [Hyphomonadaceae bacterium]|nr:ATP11 family protein [Hyphomonadaceae bacterium]
MRKDAEAVRVAAKAELWAHGRECPECGVLRRPDEFGKTNQGKPQKICKPCKQCKGDETKAKRMGFESVEEMREHYVAKRAARDRAKASKRYGTPSKPTNYSPPTRTPEDHLKNTVRHIMRKALSKSLREYELMAELCAEAALTEKYSATGQTVGDHLRVHWFTEDDIEAYFLNVSTTSGKRWTGMWPFVCGKSYKPPQPIRPAEY